MLTIILFLTLGASVIASLLAQAYTLTEMKVTYPEDWNALGSPRSWDYWVQWKIIFDKRYSGAETRHLSAFTQRWIARLKLLALIEYCLFMLYGILLLVNP